MVLRAVADVARRIAEYASSVAAEREVHAARLVHEVELEVVRDAVLRSLAEQRAAKAAETANGEILAGLSLTARNASYEELVAAAVEYRFGGYVARKADPNSPADEWVVFAPNLEVVLPRVDDEGERPGASRDDAIAVARELAIYAGRMAHA